MPGLPPPAESPTPPLTPVLCSWMNLRLPIHGWRPRGTRDWMLFFTVEGVGRFGCPGGGEFEARPRSLTLIPQGTPHDYTVAAHCETWRHWWVHFLPRDTWAEWMQWPRAGRGHRQLNNLPADLCAALKQEIGTVESGSRRRELPAHLQLSVNALERVFLLCATHPATAPLISGPRHDARVQRAQAHIAENLGAKLAIPEIARAAGLSRSRLSALFEAETGLPVMAYVEELRLQRALELLERSSLGAGEIAESTGFANAFYFSTRFKRHFGEAPTQYRRRLWQMSHPPAG